MSSQQYLVRADYEVSYPKPVVLLPGDEVQCLKKDSGWPGWSWVRCHDIEGWVPDSCLENPSDNLTHATNPFDGKELSAKRDEILTVSQEESGWALATNAMGESGWFPLFNLKPKN